MCLLILWTRSRSVSLLNTDCLPALSIENLLATKWNPFNWWTIGIAHFVISLRYLNLVLIFEGLWNHQTVSKIATDQLGKETRMPTVCSVLHSFFVEVFLSKLWPRSKSVTLEQNFHCKPTDGALSSEGKKKNGLNEQTFFQAKVICCPLWTDTCLFIS